MWASVVWGKGKKKSYTNETMEGCISRGKGPNKGNEKKKKRIEESIMARSGGENF